MGISKVYKELLNKADKLSRTGLDVHILGEPGSGRDWFVNYIAKEPSHEKIPANEFETGIQLLHAEKRGLTLHIAKIENLNSQSQNILYRTIEKREINIEGQKIQVKRIFFSSDFSLESKVKEKEFREDLYRKISSIQLRIPPLRERKEDIPIYTEMFLEELAKKHKKKIPNFGEGFWELMTNHPWSANLSELRSFLESMLLFHKGRSFEPVQAKKLLSKNKNIGDLQIKVGITLEEYEKEIIRMNLLSNSWNRKKTAEVLGISERNLYRKISTYGIEK